MVTFRTEGPACSCGLRPRGIEVATVRVNRRSLRTLWTIGAAPWRCDECRLPAGDNPVTRRWLDPPDAARVVAYRARRWPEPTL